MVKGERYAQRVTVYVLSAFGKAMGNRTASNSAFVMGRVCGKRRILPMALRIRGVKPSTEELCDAPCVAAILKDCSLVITVLFAVIK